MFFVLPRPATFFSAALLIFSGVLVFGNSTFAQNTSEPVPGQDGTGQPKMRIGINPAEDRWITLSDGSRVYQGLDISYLLGQQLFNSATYAPVLLSKTAASAAAMTQERKNQIPEAWTAWTAPQNNFPVYVDVTVTPVVETMIYASGARSDRLVFGFSPDHLNPFNQGRAGALDNEYVATQEQQQSCVKPDFFDGQLNPAGWGPFTGNFGSDLDQGLSFSILGYGFSFKKMTFDIQSQIRFLIDNNVTQQHQELVFQTTADGSDVFVSGSYSGFELGIDIQRRNTLLDALKTVLPQIVNNVIAQGLSGPWESSVISISPNIVLGAGVDEGVQNGLQLQSPYGALYQVVQAGGTTSLLQKLSGITQPFIGEPLRVYTGQPIQWISSGNAPASHLVAVRPSTRNMIAARLAAASGGVSAAAATSGAVSPSTAIEKVYQTSLTVPLDQTTRAAAQVAETSQCFGKSASWIEQTIDMLFELYAWWKYDNVLDQAPHQNLNVVPGATSVSVAGVAVPSQSEPSSSTVPTIALIDSGVDYNDGALQSLFVGTAPRQVLGFDFISWDQRPSDDNGHGTAAAKLLAQSTKAPFEIMPVKVIGSHGETHSSAVYDGFAYAVKNHADAILVPWTSEPGTLTAYQMGAAFAASAGISVFVASGSVTPSDNIFVPPGSANGGGTSFETGGLGGAQVQLGSLGVATVQMCAQWLNSHSQSQGGSNVK